MKGRQLFITTRLVPDPSMTDAEFLHQQAREMERANVATTRPNLNVGKVYVDENIMARIGALCFIRRRLPHHERAAEEFKSLYEARYGGSAPALDPSRVQVDTSPIAHDSGMAAKIDRTAKLEHAMLELKKPALDRLVACVILGIKCEDQANTMPSGQANQRHVSQCVADMLDALEDLCEMWGYAT